MAPKLYGRPPTGFHRTHRGYICCNFEIHSSESERLSFHPAVLPFVGLCRDYLHTQRPNSSGFHPFPAGIRSHRGLTMRKLVDEMWCISLCHFFPPRSHLLSMHIDRRQYKPSDNTQSNHLYSAKLVQQMLSNTCCACSN